MSDSDATTELVITRIFDAPRELVYRAFTDPDQISAWFGPVGWSVPRDSVEVEAKVGGHQRFTMVNDADPAQTSPVETTFVEVVENELLVGEEDVSALPDFAGDVMRMRLEFHDEPGGRTRLVLTQGPFSREVVEQARAGWGSSFTKLDKTLG
ncbi:SRPBCC family protein [Amorphoplanes nipponensis]|uniref:Activator of HSP90 ATPase n=1 Tax=Actinoplanes nipponensis TaxID=135950 RepID=A0A919JL87_9ACTN|nr:SRPBCC domain-containing protein [Actinoplanes nipponensis]GIE51211.1 activator of HSP90 ATPase [Actinoplanes nipponensis]